MLKSPVNGQFVVSKFSTLKNVKNVSDIKEGKRSVNSDDLSELKSSINDNNNNNNNNNDHIKKLRISKSRKSSDSGSIIEKSKHEDSSKDRRYDSYKMVKTLKEPKKSLNGSEYPSKYKCKSPKKKRDQEIFVNKKLDLINQNMQGANKNINNPEEFYMDFFNNIIKKETHYDAKANDKNNINKAETLKKSFDSNHSPSELKTKGTNKINKKKIVKLSSLANHN